MPSDEEWGNIYDVAPERTEDVRQVIRGARVFETLNGRELDKLIPLLHHRDYFPQDVIVQQGAPGAGLYVLLTGGAEVVLQAESGENMTLASLGPGRMFGEMSLLDGSPRAATVVSVARSDVLGFFRADLMDLVAHSPSLGFKIIYRLGQLMQERLLDTLEEYRNLERTARVARRATALPADDHDALAARV